MLKKWFKWFVRKLFWGGLRHFLNDKQYARFRYRLELGKPLNIEDPKTFTEKIQYIKLFRHTELRRLVASRIKVREYVTRKIGGQFLVPLIGVYDNLTPKTWKSLPEQFVLKANHGCGMIYISRSKNNEDYAKAAHEAEKWQRFDYAKLAREWAYKDLPRKIIVEQLLLDSAGNIPEDYKFFCFNGCVKLIQIDFDRFGNQKRNLYDRGFNQIEGTLLYPNYRKKVKRPAQLEQAINLAEMLSKDFNFIRVDLYLPDEHILFGELTNYPGAGFIPFSPGSLERKMGDLLQL